MLLSVHTVNSTSGYTKLSKISSRFSILLACTDLIAIIRQLAEDRARWRDIGEAYVQQWTVIG
jgi:hypothetical protein